MELTPEDINKVVVKVFWSWSKSEIGLAKLVLNLQHIKASWDERDNK